MNRTLFLVGLFLPFFFFVYLTLKRITLSYVNKKILDFGLIVSVLFSLCICTVQEIIKPNQENIFLIIANIIFLFLALFSYLFFKTRRQFMFTKTRCNIYFAVLVSLTYLFILSNNLIFSTFIWVLSGVLVYIFSYFDVFKTGADYDTNRFYSIFLTGDFCLILYCLIFLKYTIISGNYSYALNFSDLKIISSYLFANSNTDYIIAPIALCGALFSRAFIFPFSSFFSFLSNASNWFYMTIYCVFSQLYALILFLKTDMFNYLDSNFKILLIILVVINIFLLLFEKDFKIIFGYLLSIANTSFIVVYFANPKISFVYLSACYAFLVSLLALLFLKNMTSFNGRLIKTNGFIQERILLYLFKDFPYKIANIFEITGKITVTSFLKLSGLVVNTVGYHYTVYVQNRKISSVLKGIVTLFALFALLAIFIALFGNFGEMQI